MNRESNSVQGPYPLLFSPFQLGHLRLKNRLVALPVHTGFALLDAPLMPSPVPSFNLSFNLSSLRNFIDFFPLEKRFYLTRYLLQRLVNRQVPMTADDRKRVIHDFADAAARAAKAGFDMVELHGANGYLLSQFLSPFTHASPPDASLSPEERAAFPMAVIRAIRQNVPDTFPVGYRLMLREWVPDGIDLEQALAFVRHLEAEHISYLSVSAGTYKSIFSPDVYREMARPGYLGKDTAELTCRTTIPTIISGRIVTPLFAQCLLREKAADLIGLGRPLAGRSRMDTQGKGGGTG
ncbi:MAG: hypothetical protein U9P10_08695 [Thermodesulfobacteriota bacterium]|nr:hypothetical protein [Thermodesulfobacteriota bacterium]